MDLAAAIGTESLLRLNDLEDNRNDNDATITPKAFPDYENKQYYYTIVNSLTRPKDFGFFEYDIHVYYKSLEERAEAITLRDNMRRDFQGKHVYAGELIDLPIGPHLEPMWEGNFSVSVFAEIVNWLMDHRGRLKVLIHKLSGDNYWDHTAGALFLGDVAPLNLSIFLPPPSSVSAIPSSVPPETVKEGEEEVAVMLPTEGKERQ